MSQHLESLENRALFNVTLPAPFLAVANQLTTDAATLRADFSIVVTQDKANLHAISTDLKTQPHSTAGAKALAKLEIAQAVAKAKKSTDLKKYIGITKVDMNHVRAAYLLELKKPTALDRKHLTKALIALEDIEDPWMKFTAALGTGDGNVDAALGALATAYPTDSNLAALVTSDVNAAGTNYNTLYNASLTVINDEVNVLAQIPE